MIYGLLFGIIGVISFIHTNNKLHEKYYDILEDSKDNLKQSSFSLNLLNNKYMAFPLNPYNTRYSKLQKKHYLLSLIMFITLNTIAVELYLHGYTQLHFINKYLIYIPYDILICFLINQIGYYYYHRLAHTKYFYKYVHIYHHAFIHPKPFDSLVGHPLDHTFSGIFQILPMFIYRMHLVSFLVYSSILSMIGIYDHTNVKFKFLNYTSVDHHIHHIYPSKNFSLSFPIPICDILHGTYKSGGYSHTPGGLVIKKI